MQGEMSRARAAAPLVLQLGGFGEALALGRAALPGAGVAGV